MKHLKLYEEFKENDYNKIEKIIPFIIKKHEHLINWANKKFNGTGSDITELCFEYFEHLDGWYITVISKDWNNSTNRYIQHVFEKEIINYSNLINLNIKKVNYSVLHNPQNKHYVVFNVVSNELIKK
jgi:hypothetical protein